ncbi:MAG: dTMP kinase [Corynebacterium camporealensis]|uniref:dTMP kinase n=1 Tax=Corynebacterium camporealensis TaxID=161896 RepID=UPI002A92067E|nr:dTMP kinase [Corynebacterium camporealensis]MDY5840746.1 dTMP kinase [Corynebacterium camporealensis]
MLVSIEGIDGAGKNTLVNRLRTELDREFPVLSFPRYADSIHAQLAQEALYGRMGDMTDSAYAMATLFALDRHGVREQLAAAAAQPDILLLDRYVASNAAYSAARLGDDAVMDWVYELEFGKLSLPKPRLQVFLDTAVEVAADRAEQRAAADATRERDRYERDADLQANTAAAYRRLAEREWAGQWIATADTDRIIQVIKELIGK